MNGKTIIEMIVRSHHGQRWRRVPLGAAILSAVTMIVLVAPALADGATQIAGTGYFAAVAECDDAVVSPSGAGPDFALRMTGDLQGCHYVFVETAHCTPSGAYRETGTEIFVGAISSGEQGTFRTTYQFTGKFEDCPNLVGEIFGRCQHPIIAGSGTGVFNGVTGRLDFKDDVVNVIFPYRGHLRW